MYEEQLKTLGLFSPEQSRLRGGLTAAAAPRSERRAALSSALCDSYRARGNGMELAGEGQEKGLGKGCAPEGSGRATACPGQWVQP